jgi:hypothetical protein
MFRDETPTCVDRMDDADDEVPALTTLDEHLSGEVFGKLNVAEQLGVVAGNQVESGGRKVPITILTGKARVCLLIQGILDLGRRRY